MENSPDIKTNFIPLPSDVVIKIISYLDDIKDLKNCMLISKEIRDLIFRTPKIMKKINFKIEENFSDAYDFVCERGIHIRCLEFINTTIVFAVVKAFLCQMPNLEKLIITEQKYMEVESQNEEVLRKSSINHAKNLECVKNLKDLSLDFDDCDDADAITKFVCQQNDLKELYFVYSAFPSRDISSDINFKLNSLSIFINHEKVLPFLQNQAEHLESFTYHEILTFDLCEVIFGKMKKLKKLILEAGEEEEESWIYDDSNPQWKSESLKYFEEEESWTEVKNLSSKFPNLDHLTCSHFAPCYETYSNLTTLDISNFTCSNFHDAKFPKLKNVVISGMIGPSTNNFKLWENFIINSPSIENIEISSIYHSKKCVFPFIVKQINKINNLKSFKICADFSKGYESISEEEEFKSTKIYKIWIDVSNKTVKTSYCVAKTSECKKTYNFLKENFKEFKFNDFGDGLDIEEPNSSAKIIKL